MIQLIRGFKDILPGDIELWQHIEQTAARLFERFGFNELRIPIMERTALFARSIGEDTDIVEKEMYTFADRKGELLTLRPEATASVVRAYIQHRLYAQDPVQKLYTIGPMFRRERPQKGRYRQFYQINAEVFGVAAPWIDAQLIFMLMTLLEQLAVSQCVVHLNSLGCPECRPAFKKELADFIEQQDTRLCADCRRRRVQNPLRVLDCKVPGCREATIAAPLLSAGLCPTCDEHFKSVCHSLETLKIPFERDPRLVRGLDYYTRTTFEIQTTSLGAQSAVAGGGRYDGLIQALEGPDQPAIGFAIGLDRLAEIVAQQAEDLARSLIRPPDVYLAILGANHQALGLEWSCMLSRRGLHTETDFSDRSLKAQLKRAHRLQAPWVLIAGDTEIEARRVILRNMDTKEQQEIPVASLIEAVIEIVKPENATD